MISTLSHPWMGSFAVLIPLWEDAGAVEELMHGVRLSAGQGCVLAGF